MHIVGFYYKNSFSKFNNQFDLEHDDSNFFLNCVGEAGGGSVHPKT